jgi:hypothetical protein
MSGLTNGVSPAEQMLEPYEEVLLGGKVRRLKAGINMLCELQAATGDNPFSPNSKLVQAEDSPISVRLMTWACLWDEKPRPTIEEVGSWLQPVFGEVLAALLRLKMRSNPEPAKVKRKRPR